MKTEILLEHGSLTALTSGVRPSHLASSQFLEPNSKPTSASEDSMGSRGPFPTHRQKVPVGLALPWLAAAIVILGKSGTRAQKPSQQPL